MGEIKRSRREIVNLQVEGEKGNEVNRSRHWQAFFVDVACLLDAWASWTGFCWSSLG